MKYNPISLAFDMRAPDLGTPTQELYAAAIEMAAWADELGLNSRVRWEFRPGQELFVVYNEGFDVLDDEFSSNSRRLTLKAGLTFRF